MTSPQPIIFIAVRAKTQPNAFRIPIPVKTQADATPRQGNSTGGLRTKVLRLRGFRSLFFNSLGLLARWSSKPRLQPSKQSGSGLFQAFENLLGLFGFHNQQPEGERVPCLTKVLKDRTK